MSALQDALVALQVKVSIYQSSSCFDLLSKIDLKENMNEKYLKAQGRHPSQIAFRNINFYQITSKIKRQINLLFIDTATSDYFVLRDFLKEQKKMKDILAAIGAQPETVYFLVAYTDQQKEYDQCQFCIFFKIFYNRAYQKQSLYKIQSCLQEFLSCMDKSQEDSESFLVMNNSSIISQNLQLQKEKLLQQFCGITNQEVIHVECLDKHLEVKEESRKVVPREHQDESHLIKKMSYKNNPKFKILMMQRGNEQVEYLQQNKSPSSVSKEKGNQASYLSDVSRPLLPLINSSVRLKKVTTEKSRKGAQFDLRLAKVSHIDHCINALQTQQYQKLISQVQYQGIQKSNQQSHLYQRHPSSQVPLSQSHSQSYFINSFFSRKP